MSTTSLCPSATREHGPGAKRVLPLLFLTCLLDAAGVGLIVPLLPTLIGSVAPLAVRDAATRGAALVMTFALLQLFFSPVLGSLSDRFGRRPVLVLAMLGFALSYLLLALADSLWMLFLGRALAGLTGASVATAMACAADLGTHGQRTRHFGWLYAGLALGMILGPALGGLLAVHGTTLPLLLAAGLCLLNALLAGLFLEETLPPTRRRRLDPRRMNALRSISGLARQPGVGRLLAVLALVFLGLQAVMVVWPFFVIEKFHWSSAWIGYSLALYGVLAVLAQTLGVNLCKRHLDDARLLRLGLALQGCGLLLFALVDSSFWLVCALLPFALGSLATPAMQGLLSARVPVDRQGELQGVLSSLMSLAAIVGPPLMSGLFHWGSGPLAPLPWPARHSSPAPFSFWPGWSWPGNFDLREKNDHGPDRHGRAGGAVQSWRRRPRTPWRTGGGVSATALPRRRQLTAQRSAAQCPAARARHRRAAPRQPAGHRRRLQPGARRAVPAWRAGCAAARPGLPSRRRLPRRPVAQPAGEQRSGLPARPTDLRPG